jgi:hypothetical protein
VRPARSLNVVGASPLAAELRRLIAGREEPGWELHRSRAAVPPARAGRAAAARVGQRPVFNLLDRSGFAYVEEVAATPDECLLDLRNGGPRFVAAVRQVISDLARSTAPAAGTASRERLEPGAPPLPVLAAGTLRAFQVAAAWAVAGDGARTAGDLILLAGGTRQLPPDDAAAWDHIRQLDLRQVVGPLLPDVGMAMLAGEPAGSGRTGQAGPGSRR